MLHVHHHHPTSMWMKVAFIIVIWLSSNTFLTFSINSSTKLRFCIVESAHNSKTINRSCSSFNENHTPVECRIVNDRINCLRRLIHGEADFAVFEPEDLVAYSSAYSESSHILITNELRFNSNKNANFEMVAIVSKEIGSLSAMVGKKFCHPGLDSPDSDWTRIFANYLQNWLIPKKCDVNATLLENDISSWSEFFESACIAGPWSFDAKVDSQLKVRYRNLCALCDNPNGCYSGDKYHGPEGSLLCLTDNIGDIAWAKLDDATRHFKALGISSDSFNYICPDGLIRSVNSGRPCTWISKPWSVIAAHRDVAEKVSRLINSLSDREFPWQNKLLELMKPYHVTLVSTGVLKTPEDYLRQFSGFSSANARWSCTSREIKWCVASNLESGKCHWIRDAAVAYGIEPTISCHQYPSRVAAINAVNTGFCDLFIVKPEEFVKAEAKNLITLLEVMPKKIEDLNKINILTKNSYNIDDLKGKRACFTSRQSIEWRAFMAVMKLRTNESNWNCPNAMDKYFKEIIVADLIEKNPNVNLIESTYNCLTSDNGDVAFVSGNYKNQSYTQKWNLMNVRGLEENQFDVNKLNYLAWTSLGSVMVNVNMTEVRRNELKTMLMQLNAWFGSKFINQHPAIALYGSYDTKEGVIFQDKAQSLQENTDYIRAPRSYNILINKLKNLTIDSSICNNVNQNNISATILFIVTSVILLINHF